MIAEVFFIFFNETVREDGVTQKEIMIKEERRVRQQPAQCWREQWEDKREEKTIMIH